MNVVKLFLIPLRTHNADKSVVHWQRKSILGTPIKIVKIAKIKVLNFLVFGETGDDTNNE